MTTNNPEVRDDYTANGSTVEFPITFDVLDAYQVVFSPTAAGAVVQKNENDDWVLLYDLPPASGEAVSIWRETPITNEVRFEPYSAFRAEDFNFAFDKNAQIDQELQKQIDASIKLPPDLANDWDGDVTIRPDAGKALLWNEEETALINSESRFNDIVPLARGYAEAAEVSASEAQLSAEKAEGHWTDFDEKYLGAWPSDPSTNNFGGPLIDGAIYFNDTECVLKVYDLETSKWYFTAPNPDDMNSIIIVSENIEAVKNVDANMSSIINVEANLDSINAVDQNQANIDSVADNMAPILNVDANMESIKNVDANVADITTVAANIDSVVIDANNIDSIITVAGQIDSVNWLSDHYQISPEPPVSPETGDLWLNSNSGILHYYNGSAWEPIASGGATTVQKSGDTGSAFMPAGTTEQRDAAPEAGMLRWNTNSHTWDSTSGSTPNWEHKFPVLGLHALENSQFNGAVNVDLAFTANKGATVTGATTINGATEVNGSLKVNNDMILHSSDATGVYNIAYLDAETRMNSLIHAGPSWYAMKQATPRSDASLGGIYIVTPSQANFWTISNSGDTPWIDFELPQSQAQQWQDFSPMDGLQSFTLCIDNYDTQGIEMQFIPQIIWSDGKPHTTSSVSGTVDIFSFVSMFIGAKNQKMWVGFHTVQGAPVP